MVIQRWQTVFLLLAAICMALVSFLPLGTGMSVNGAPSFVDALDFIPLFVINILVTLLLLIDIFLFRDLKLQKKVALVNVFLEAVSIIVTGLLMLPAAGYIEEMTWTAILPVVALILTILARSRMAADERLLKSYDRIR